MSKTTNIQNEIPRLSESKSICPKCDRNILFDKIEDKCVKQNNFIIKMKCKYNKHINITQNMKRDFVTFNLITIES